MFPSAAIRPYDRNVQAQRTSNGHLPDNKQTLPIHHHISNSYTMGCPPVRGDKQRAGPEFKLTYPLLQSIAVR